MYVVFVLPMHIPRLSDSPDLWVVVLLPAFAPVQLVGFLAISPMSSYERRLIIGYYLDVSAVCLILFGYVLVLF